MFVSRQIRTKRIKRQLGIVLGGLILVSGALLWVLNVQAGVAVWTPPTMTQISSGEQGSCGISDGKAYCWGNFYLQTRSIPTAVDDSGLLAGKTILSVAVGDQYACAVASNSQVYCWGRNDYGQLGDNSTTYSATPVAVNTAGVLSGKTIKSVATGENHVCAIASDNNAYCWGRNDYGQLGNNSTTESHVPVAVNTAGVLSGKTVTSVSVGQYHACVVASDSKAYCWGYNFYGQLGNNSTTESHVPVAVFSTGVLSGKTVTSIAAGYNYTCAIASDNNAYCWGDGSYGQLGNNSTGQSIVPVAVYTAGVLSGKTVKSIKSGAAHTCAIASDNLAYCWGLNDNGQLGNNSTTQSTVPVAVTTSGVLSGKTVTSIATGGWHTCAIASNAQAYCWGKGSDGQLGNASLSVAQSLVPINVLFTSTFNAANYRLYANADSATPGSPLAGINTATTLTSSGQAFRVRTGVKTTPQLGGISGGASHGCGISAGNAYCWGQNAYGQLGNNSTSQSNVPVAVNTAGVLSGKTIKVVVAGNGYSCAIASDNNAYCWGRGNFGQLGDNLATQSNVPVAVSTAGVLSGKTVLSIAVSGNGNSTASAHTCVVASDNNAYCWGGNSNGQLGNNSTSQSNVPVAVNTAGVLSGKTVRSVTTGSFHSCAVASDNQAYCWGLNSSGQLGNNSTSQSLVPVAVNTAGVLSGKTVKQVSAGALFGCAVTTDNNAYCWGSNIYGQLGNNSTSQSLVPVAVNTAGVLSGKTVLSISSEGYAVCAVASDNQAYCWGSNSNGQLGDNSITESHVPVAVYTAGAFSGKTIIAVVSAQFHACAITSDFSAYCWGAGSLGRLGNDSTSDSYVPVAVATEGYISGADINPSDNTYKLQYAQKTVGACSAQTGFADVTASTAVAYNTNASVANGASITSNASDPVPTADSVPQTYISASGTFTNSTTITGGKTGLWDFSLKDNSGTYSTTYCLRMTYGSGTNIEGTVQYPEFTTTARANAVGSPFRLYQNANSLTPGNPLGDTNESAKLTSPSQAFRLRMGVTGLLNMSKISAGASHTCAIDSGSKAYCWGRNNVGQLGNGTGSDALVPTSVNTNGALAGKTILSIATGTRHTCVIASDNQAYCWGAGYNGQLGNSTNNDSWTPIAVNTSGLLSGKTVLSISAGNDHTCVVASDNNAYCWGSNGNGQLGNNSITESNVPVAVNTAGVLSGKTVTSVAAATNFTCAIASDVKAYCWGNNNQGQLGNNSTTESHVPVAVNTAGVFSGKTILSISATGLTTDAHACAVASDNLVYCWGRNFYGELGNNSTSDSLVPVAVNTAGVLSGKTILAVKSSGVYTCAIASDNQVYCWGRNAEGQLGDNSTTESHVPVAVNTAGVLSGKTVTALAASGAHTCAIASDSQAYCWGESSYGELGNNSTTQSTVPATVGVPKVKDGTTVRSVTTGDVTGCSVAVSGDAYCWGRNAEGQLGDNTWSNSSTPVAVDTSGVLSGKTVQSISAGWLHACAVASDSQAYCWGNGGAGQLGDNLGATTGAPVAVDTSGVLSGKTILSVKAGDEHTCAIASDNQAYCWGSGASGRLGNNSTGGSAVPVAVDTSGVFSGKSIRSITAGSFHTCAIASDNQAYCWGGNGNGQLGNNSTSQSIVPVAVDTSGVLSGKTIRSIATSGEHTCAIASDNQAYCWGYNGSGQLGNNSTTPSSVPVAVNTAGVLSGKTILALSISWSHTCVVASDNQVYCWGENAVGELGNNSTTPSSVPVAVNTAGVLSGKTVLSVASSYAHSCAMTSDNQAYCWGANDSGQLGDGSTANSSVPVAVQFNPDTFPASVNSVAASANSYVLQYAQKSAATCSVQTGFANVTASTPIAFNTNSSATNGASISTTANDPLGSSQTTAQTYVSAVGMFTNSSAITAGTMGMWDFSLKDNSSLYDTSYCLRIAYSDGTSLTGAMTYPEVRTTSGTLSVAFVNESDAVLANPSIIFNNIAAKGSIQDVTASTGTQIQKLRVYNDLATNGWSVSVAATGGTTALWDRTDHLVKYDFNDASGGSDGADSDLLGGALTLFPGSTTVASPLGCSTSGISKGTTASFSEGTLDSITLMSASGSVANGCNYDMTNLGLSQSLPASQAPGTYTLDITVTVVAL